MHVAAAGALATLLGAGERLVTHAYVVVETSALVQRRLPPPALRDLHRRLLPVVEVRAVAEDEHDRAVSALVAAPSGPSLVDRASFEVMRAAGIESAFTFDRHFAAEGFHALP